MPLGLMPGMGYEEKEVALGPGEGVLFCSDGVVEAESGLPLAASSRQRATHGSNVERV